MAARCTAPHNFLTTFWWFRLNWWSKFLYQAFLLFLAFRLASSKRSRQNIVRKMSKSQKNLTKCLFTWQRRAVRHCDSHSGIVIKVLLRVFHLLSIILFGRICVSVTIFYWDSKVLHFRYLATFGIKNPKENYERN